jgi:hypothetical protein
MFEPEVWRMVRRLESDRSDPQTIWRIRLARERRAPGGPLARLMHSLRRAPSHRPDAAASVARSAGAARCALPGEGS